VADKRSKYRNGTVKNADTRVFKIKTRKRLIANRNTSVDKKREPRWREKMNFGSVNLQTSGGKNIERMAGHDGFRKLKKNGTKETPLQ